MKFDCTGVILAGGKNSRLPGRKKTFQKVGNSMILENISAMFASLFKETIIVVNEPREFANLDMLFNRAFAQNARIAIYFCN